MCIWYALSRPFFSSFSPVVVVAEEAAAREQGSGIWF
jgi:hypothetical protein